MLFGSNRPAFPYLPLFCHILFQLLNWIQPGFTFLIFLYSRSKGETKTVYEKSVISARKDCFVLWTMVGLEIQTWCHPYSPKLIFFFFFFINRADLVCFSYSYLWKGWSWQMVVCEFKRCMHTFNILKECIRENWTPVPDFGLTTL